MAWPEIDNTCRDILQFFLARLVGKRGPIRFNDLFRALNESGRHISRPTLSLHLKHLVDKELLLRTQVSKQNVNYRFYSEKWSALDEVLEKTIEIEKFFEEEEERFKTDTAIAQVGHVFSVLYLRSLNQLKHELLKISEPEKEFEHNLYIASNSRIWDHFVRWLVQNYKEKDDDYRKEIIETIEKMINNTHFTIFTDSLNPTT